MGKKSDKTANTKSADAKDDAKAKGKKEPFVRPALTPEQEAERKAKRDAGDAKLAEKRLSDFSAAGSTLSSLVEEGEDLLKRILDQHSVEAFNDLKELSDELKKDVNRLSLYLPEKVTKAAK